jgi:hypothetical protein
MSEAVLSRSPGARIAVAQQRRACAQLTRILWLDDGPKGDAHRLEPVRLVGAGYEQRAARPQEACGRIARPLSPERRHAMPETTPGSRVGHRPACTGRRTVRLCGSRGGSSRSSSATRPAPANSAATEAPAHSCADDNHVIMLVPGHAFPLNVPSGKRLTLIFLLERGIFPIGKSTR